MNAERKNKLVAAETDWVKIMIKEKFSKFGIRIQVIALIALAASGMVFADSLELADGTVLEGDFVGSSNGIVMFNTGAGIEAYPESQVVGIYLSDGVATAEAMAHDGVKRETVKVYVMDKEFSY